MSLNLKQWNIYNHLHTIFVRFAMDGTRCVHYDLFKNKHRNASSSPISKKKITCPSKVTLNLNFQSLKQLDHNITSQMYRDRKQISVATVAPNEANAQGERSMARLVTTSGGKQRDEDGCAAQLHGMKWKDELHG